MEGIAPAGAASALCSLSLTALGMGLVDVNLDALLFTQPGELFIDGFESGDTSAWTDTIVVP